MNDIPRISVQLSFSTKFEKFLELSTSIFLSPFLLHSFLSLFMPSLSLLLFASPLRLARGTKGTFSLFHSYTFFSQIPFLLRRYSFSLRCFHSLFLLSPFFFSRSFISLILSPRCSPFFDTDEHFPALARPIPASSKFRYCQYHKSVRCAPAKIDDTHH